MRIDDCLALLNLVSKDVCVFTLTEQQSFVVSSRGRVTVEGEISFYRNRWAFISEVKSKTENGSDFLKVKREPTHVEFCVIVP